jgi:hypothetical protein
MNEVERWKEYEKKAIFVKGLAAALNLAPRIGVRNLTYSVDAKQKETVEVEFDNGFYRRVDVTADSELAVLDDIRKVLG